MPRLNITLSKEVLDLLEAEQLTAGLKSLISGVEGVDISSNYSQEIE